MLKALNKISPIIMQSEEQVFNQIVAKDHPFRRLKEIVDFSKIVKPLHTLYSNLGTEGIAVEKGFLCLLIQFWEDYSDREMEKCVRENMAIRWFTGFGLLEETPDHTYFCKLRTRIGANNLANIFNTVNEKLKALGLFGDMFTFIDASAIISKTALWDERDKAILEGATKLNNVNVKDFAADNQARFGAKSKTKIWFGYKKHEAVDMRFGLIKKTAVTPANVPDYKATKYICPKQGMVFSDKGYDYGENNLVLKANNCHAGTIRKNNNKIKNKDLDGWVSKMRMPYESTFAKCRKRAKFRGQTKVFFQVTFEAICHNLKKALVYLPTIQQIQNSP